VTALLEAESFGDHLWQEAARRGVMEAEEVVVIGDGAHWIWNIAKTQFPQATQIVDWYHASGYVWKAASALWGESEPQRADWAHRQLARLWEGKVEEVLLELEQHQGAGEGITEALSYYTTHRGRMEYAAYRERGLQIGSGSVESGCKQLVSARLKGAGMIWDGSGAEQVAVVRAWLKSGRWEEAMALRRAPGRSYQRKSCVREGEKDGTGVGGEQAAAVGPAAVPSSRGLAPEVLRRCARRWGKSGSSILGAAPGAASSNGHTMRSGWGTQGLRLLHDNSCSLPHEPMPDKADPWCAPPKD